MKRDRQRQLSAGGGASKREVLFDPLSPALSHEGRGSELFYQHDAIGNVWLVMEQDGDDMALTAEFRQDAYGNPLAADGFVGSDWETARADGITEHQTGKWIDPFSGLYFFHARWYDRETGRFVSRDPVPLPNSSTGTGCPSCGGSGSGWDRNEELRRRHASHYLFCRNKPTAYYDPDGGKEESLNWSRLGTFEICQAVKEVWRNVISEI